MLWNTIKSLFTHSNPNARNEEPISQRVRSLIKEKRYADAERLVQHGLDLPNTEAQRLSLLGEINYHASDKIKAEELFKKALQLQPSLAEGHYGLSLLYYDTGHIEDALAHAQYSRNMKPDDAPILSQLGLCYIAVRDFSNARDVLRQAALLDAENVPTLNNLGIAFHATGEVQNALYYFQRALSLNPGYGPALENMRTLFGIDSHVIDFDPESGTPQSRIGIPDANPNDTKDQAEADLVELEEHFEQFPEDIENIQQLVSGHLRALNLEEARDILHIALAHHPDSVPLLCLTAQTAHQIGQNDRASALYDKALEINPDHLDSLIGYSQVLRDLGKVNDALIHIEHVVNIEENQNTLLQLAAAQANACQYTECLATCDRLESMAPQLAPILLTSRSVSHAYLGHFDEAFKLLDTIQEHDPSNLGLRCFMGLLHLMNERYQQGWDGYRYRFLMESNDQRILPFPMWQGEPLEDRTILILAEQGLGDQIMFASCLPDLLALHPQNVLLEANARVATTLARSFPQIHIISSSQKKGFDWFKQDYVPDCYVHIADLPRHFRSSIDDFPSITEYLKADTSRVSYWSEHLDRENSLPKVGISWRGGLQKTRQSIRSLELTQLLPLFSNSDVQFVNLQYGDISSELRDFSVNHGVTILNYPKAIEDLDEFAALISALDLVITVCNTTVHYTGALGRECWVMTPFVPEWRYGINSPSMRWYPSTRMFRQHRSGDWDGVLERVATALHDRFSRAMENHLNGSA